MVHIDQTYVLSSLQRFQSWYTRWYTVGTHWPVSGTHLLFIDPNDK